MTNRPVHVLRLRPEPDPTEPDGIRRLRALLKATWDFGFGNLTASLAADKIRLG